MKKKELRENPTRRRVYIATALFFALCILAAILAVGGLLGL